MPSRAIVDIHLLDGVDMINVNYGSIITLAYGINLLDNSILMTLENKKCSVSFKWFFFPK